MILDIRTDLLKSININLNQLIFLSLVLDTNQKNHQDIVNIVSQISDNEIQDLIDNNLIIRHVLPVTKFEPTEKLMSLLQNNNMFEVFYDTFPTYVNRPDGTKGFLKGNKKKCEKQFISITKKIDANHIISCLKYDIDQKTISGKLGYMKTMWKWLTQCEWEIIEEQMNFNQTDIKQYGTDLL